MSWWLFLSIKVTSPKLGPEIWHPGSTYAIKWIASGSMSSTVKILLYSPGFPKPPDLGARVEVIKGSTLNNGLFNWKIPSLHRTGKHVVRVQTIDDKVWGDSEILKIESEYPFSGVRHRAPPAPEGPNALVRMDIIDLINKYRKSKGLNTLNIDNCLWLSAQKHSEWMRDKGHDYFYDSNNNVWINSPHDAPSGTTTVKNCTEYEDAENVHFIPPPLNTLAQKAVDDWKKSQLHNVNMLGDHTKIGVGTAEGKSQYWPTLYYVTAKFR
jgi:uncharacterized protein YkwD